MRFVLALATFTAAASCQTRDRDGSSAKDIFTSDEGDPQAGNSRRRPATDGEKNDVIKVGDGCTGHLLTPSYVLTASHCNATAATKASNGVIIEKMIETNGRLDYAIYKVKWRDGFPAGQFHTQKIAMQASDVTMAREPGAGDAVFTVGFPVDKESWGATYAEGQLKMLERQFVLFDVGTINGNSGGPVWRKSDKMLVTMTNGGPHRHGEEHWNQNDPSDPATWNSGPALWEMFAQSAFLRRIFPSGTFDAGAEAALLQEGGGTAIGPFPKLKLKLFVDATMADPAAEPGSTPPCAQIGYQATFVHPYEFDAFKSLEVQPAYGPRGCRGNQTFSTTKFDLTLTGTNDCGEKAYTGDAIVVEDKRGSTCDAQRVHDVVVRITRDGAVETLYGKFSD